MNQWDEMNEITLITYKNSNNYKFDKRINIVTPFFNFFDFKGRYSKYILCLFTLLKILLFDRKNLVLSFQANIFTIMICNFLNIKILSRSNSSSTGWSQNIIKQYLLSHYFKKADKIIVNSFEFKKEMDKKYNINCKCILNPFDFKKIKKLAFEKTKKIFKTNSIRLISVGRLTDQKDQLTTLKAIRDCKSDNVELVILGKGKNESSLKKFCHENKLNKKIKFMGYKKNPFKYIKQAEILILSSIFEGSPNILVEALFLKKYVISTDCPTGPNEILNKGKFGELVQIGNSKQIIKLIDNYKKNKKIKKKILMGYNSLKRYDYKSNCDHYYKLIKKFS